MDHVGKELKGDKELVLLAVKQNWQALKYASKELRDDKDVVIEAVKKYGSALCYASQELKNDKELVLLAVKQNGDALKYASQELKSDKELVLLAVKQNGHALKYASQELRDDKEVLLGAVKQDWWALQHATPELKKDKELVLLAVKQDWWALCYASQELKGDKGVVIEAVKQNWQALCYASKELRDDKEVVIEAVKRYGGALQHASFRLKDDKELVLLAMKQDSSALQHASFQLRNDKEIVLEAVKQNGHALQHASRELKNDKEVVIQAVRQKGHALQFASQELQNNKELVLLAVKQDGRALGYASMELRNQNELSQATKKRPESMHQKSKWRNHDPQNGASEDETCDAVRQRLNYRRQAVSNTPGRPVDAKHGQKHTGRARRQPCHPSRDSLSDKQERKKQKEQQEEASRAEVAKNVEPTKPPRPTKPASAAPAAEPQGVAKQKVIKKRPVGDSMQLLDDMVGPSVTAHAPASMSAHAAADGPAAAWNVQAFGIRQGSSGKIKLEGQEPPEKKAKLHLECKRARDGAANAADSIKTKSDVTKASTAPATTSKSDRALSVDKQKLTRRQLEALPLFDIGDIVWSNCGSAYGWWPGTVTGERDGAGLYRVYYFSTTSDDEYGDFTESKLTPFTELVGDRDSWHKTALKTPEENAAVGKDKEQAVDKAKSSLYEKNPNLSYRLIAHAEFQKLQADHDVEENQECSHCMEEWAETTGRRLVMMSCDGCQACKSIYHKECALQIMKKNKVCPRCQDSEGRHRDIDAVVPFGIKQGSSGKIKLEGQALGS